MSDTFKALVLAILLCGAAGTCFAADLIRRRKSASADPQEITLFVLDDDAILWAIRQVEPGDKPLLIGLHGERSAYQFKPGTWATYTIVPFLQAGFHPKTDEMVARKHLAFLRRKLAERGITPTPEWIAATWHHWIDCGIVEAKADSAMRVATLYYERVERTRR